jgi:succinate dehydrogenase / fumarate reductase iron-sulfur subunit
MCGCCLEICPNFSVEGDFAGAIAAVNSFRMLNEEQETNHHKEISEQYRKRFYEKCGKSLACQKVCPVGLPVEELIVRSNAAAIWKK